MADKAKDLVVPPNITGPCPPNFGFWEARIRQVYEHPDRTHDIQSDDLHIRLYYKGADSVGDLLAVRLSPTPKTVVFAFRLFASLFREPLAEVALLDIVRQMAERFGLEMLIGEQLGRFFVSQSIPLPKYSGAELVQGNNPRNHSFMPATFIKVNPPNISVALAFCLDTTEYGKWLASNGRG